MENRQQYPINISAPNLVNVCVDQICNGEMVGRLYHCYKKDASEFSNVVELVKKVEQLFDRISFPQASTQSRSFVESSSVSGRGCLEKVVEQEEVVQHRGKCGSFLVCVQFRQNATWQGNLFWAEKGMKKEFSNTLDFIKMMDQALAVTKK